MKAPRLIRAIHGSTSDVLAPSSAELERAWRIGWSADRQLHDRQLHERWERVAASAPVPR